MQTLLVVRHCESEHHLNGLTGGWTDSPLTPRGCRQAARVAGRVRTEVGTDPCALYSSDLRRARETAEAIGDALGQPLRLCRELREINNGIAAGMLYVEAEPLANPLPAGALRIDHRFFEGGETWREFHTRVTTWLDTLAAAESRLPILVTHGGTAINIIAWWLHLDADALERVSFGGAAGGVTRLTTNRCGERTLELLGDTTHLRDL
jgi:broad specificity phosphatase PhoE